MLRKKMASHDTMYSSDGAAGQPQVIRSDNPQHFRSYKQLCVCVCVFLHVCLHLFDLVVPVNNF